MAMQMIQTMTEPYKTNSYISNLSPLVIRFTHIKPQLRITYIIQNNTGKEYLFFLL